MDFRLKKFSTRSGKAAMMRPTNNQRRKNTMAETDTAVLEAPPKVMKQLEALHHNMPKSGYPDHPIAAAFPMMNDKEFADFAEDIAKVGLREDIVLLDGKVLDGRNRQKACLLKKQQPFFRLFDAEFDGESPVAFVESHNLKRRHLTPSQAAAAAAELLPFFEAEAKHGGDRKSEDFRKSRWQICTLESGDSSNGQNESQIDTSDEFSQVAPTTMRKGGKSTKRAGSMLNVSERSVAAAKRLKQDDPKAFADVKAGRKSLNKAVSGKPSAGSKAAAEYESAVERVEKVCGKLQATGIRQGAILKQRKDVIAYAKLTDAKMLAIRTLIDEGWQLNKALNYKAEDLNPTHRIIDLAWRAQAVGGKYEQDVWIENSGILVTISAKIMRGEAREQAIVAAQKKARKK